MHQQDRELLYRFRGDRVLIVFWGLGGDEGVGEVGGDGGDEGDEGVGGDGEES
ncbi:hypothetical protein [Anabaena azotica]|uniref:Uncharacterized protein n=1 Tax=Anabaena azotica FACHB-119 TaxID=947527 RepID=A0ABR8D2Y4_9NOST|nr:hypothetical protein [Anabaena azotica]MBD2500801.1 hypothetical protein [Anabaena azotica FACHB-119]